MGLSPYFNHGDNNSPESKLLEDVVVESIQIMGHLCYYMPREEFDDTDFIFGENVDSRFEKAYAMEMYLANVEGFEGDGDFFSKFGLEMRETTNVIVARRTFSKYVPSVSRPRPREGDLVYVPLLQRIFEIKFVEEELNFFSVGKRDPYIYELRAEVFRFSNENIDTGVAEIDAIIDAVSYTVELSLTGGNTLDYTKGEIVYQGSNLSVATATAEVSRWERANSLLYIINTKGAFGANTVVGVTSNAQYTVTTADGLGAHTNADWFDNKLLQDQANTILQPTFNPFGEP